MTQPIATSPRSSTGRSAARKGSRFDLVALTLSLLVGLWTVPTVLAAAGPDATTGPDPGVSKKSSAVSGVAESSLSAATRWIDRALGADPADRALAIAELRRHGAPAVAELVSAEPASPEAREGWLEVLDQVCAQRGCVHSRLFWHTNLDAALAEAESSGRPVLSLRLLGRLDEELSCANSRFFRRMLYPDPRVADLLRERFVLHWSSERPAPRLTIEFGDGRALVGTLTGNSVHYVLDRQGRVVDALPGLYDPGVFVAALLRAAPLADELSDLDLPRFRQQRAAAHAAILAELSPDAEPPVERLKEELVLTPTARQAGVLATTKAFVEMPLLEAFGRPSLPRLRVDESRLRRPPGAPASWGLSAESEALLRQSLESVAPQQADLMLQRFRGLLEQDTLRNEYLLHPEIHRWLANPDFAVTLEDVNRVVYADLFLTPATDPWLGLATEETLLALSGVESRSAGRWSSPSPRSRTMARVESIE